MSSPFVPPKSVTDALPALAKAARNLPYDDYDPHSTENEPEWAALDRQCPICYGVWLCECVADASLTHDQETADTVYAQMMREWRDKYR